MKNEIDEKNKLLETVNELVPIIVFEGKQSFGELALQNRRPRAGTVVTLSDCYFAVINGDNYEKLLKKDIASRMQTNVSFLRQIPYIAKWLMRDTQGLYMLCHEKRFTSRGVTIAREGDPSNKVYIVL